MFRMLNIILFPFAFLYRGVKFIFKIPYFFVSGIAKLFKGNNKPQNTKKQIAEIKPNEQIKVVKGVRSAYDTPREIPKETDPVKLQQQKEQNTIIRQKEFEKLVKKARIEEEKRIKEQERKRIIQEQKEKERQKKELERKLREEEKEKQRLLKEEKDKKEGKKSFFESLTKPVISKSKLAELKAKKTVLDEQIKDKSSAASRFQKPLLFEYIARNVNGELEKSTIEALSRVDVHSFLLAEGYEVYDITIAKSAGNIQIGSYKLNKSKLVFYLSQLSAYLKSGIALADAVKLLDNQAKNVNEKKVWRAVYYDLSMGDNLSLALEKRKTTFPKLLINMVKTAEMTGNLTETLDDMVDYYTESEATRKQMKSAMMYPTIITVFAIAVVIFILIWIVPQFVDIYKDLGSELPAITKLVISISNFLQSYFIYILIGIIILAVIFIYVFKNVKSFRRTIQEIVMHMPVFGNIIIYNEVTIFTKTFANLINHNVFITDSIDVLSKITENEIYKKLIYDTAVNLTKGETISKAFQNHWAFPIIAYQMLITGEKTGRLGPMMEKVSEYYQEQHRNIINQMKTLIEPILIVSLAVVVGFILLSVILPMYGMYEGIQ